MVFEGSGLRGSWFHMFLKVLWRFSGEGPHGGGSVLELEKLGSDLSFWVIMIS